MDHLKEDRKKKHTVRKVLVAILLLLVAGVAGASLIFYCITGTTIQNCYEEAESIAEDMTEDSFLLNSTTSIYYADGSLMAELRKDASSHYLKYEDIPKEAIDAIVAIEDRSFWQNKGYDVKGIIRAGLPLLTEHEISQGGSTITQQLCKLALLKNENDYARKVKEIFLARKVTETYGKDQIMEWYINYCCYANNIYGLKDAAEAYLGKNVEELTLSEICYLCAIPNRPEYYDPWEYPDHAIERRDKILAAMLEEQMITEEEYAYAVTEEIEVKEETATRYTPDDETTYAISCAAEILMEENGFSIENDFETMEEYDTYRKAYDAVYEEAVGRLYTDGYTIHTSIVQEYQDVMQEAVDQNLEDSTEISENGIYNLQGGVTAVDNQTHKVIGIVGRRTQEGTDIINYNRAYQYYRQPGSSIKPLIVYTPALMMGYDKDSMLKNVDVQSAYAAYKRGDPVSSLGGTSYPLQNAVTWSRNGCALVLYDEITPEQGLSYLLDMGFSRIVPDDYYLSSCLGGMTYGVNTVEMASAYSTLSNYGVYTKVDCITSMVSPDGKEPYQEPKQGTIYERNAAIEMTDIMRDVIKSGTAAGMKWDNASDLPAAGKTGTTNDDTNGWFCGYTAPYTVTAWVGKDDNTTVSNLYGIYNPIYIWKDVMLALTEGYDGDNGIFEAEKEAEEGQKDGEIWTVVGSGANVRDGASSSSNVVFALPGGTEVQVVKYGEDWSKVLIDGETYYIYSPLLTR